MLWSDYYWKCCMEGGRLIHPQLPYIWYDENCIRNISDSRAKCLVLEHKPNEIRYWDGKIYNPSFAGGVMRSFETFGFGTFSADIMMPQGKGLWGSFWLCGDGPWPQSGEIDICEGYSDNNYIRLTTPYFPWLNPSWKTTNNIHYAENGEHKNAKPRSISMIRQPYNPARSFINYECLWTPSEIVIKVDGKVVRKDRKAMKRIPGDIRMHVIFNLWCEDPTIHEIKMETPMIIRNFKYKPL